MGDKSLSILRIHRLLPLTKAEGPGERSCIWVQGCPIQCEGCFNPETWSEYSGTEIAVDDLFQKIISGPTIEGVTFLGGEPFAQAGPLAELAQKLQTKGLSVVVFTGYTIEYLRKTNSTEASDLLKNTDLLIDGPFIKEKADTSRPWVGSSNQQFHFLTDRYKYLENCLSKIFNRLEIRIMPDGRILVNGLASDETLKSLF